MQKSGLHAIEISKDQRKSIYNKCKEAIKYAPYPQEMTLTLNSKKQVPYLNVLARIQLELAALDAAKELKPSVISEQRMNKSKASLNLAELLISKRARWLWDKEFNDEERERCSKIVSLEGNTYYRPLGPKKKEKTIK